MKKLKGLFASVLIGILFVLATPFAASAASATASLSGPAAVRAGDTITITLSVNGSDVLGVSGTIRYSTSQLTLNSARVVYAWGGTCNTNTAGTVIFSSYASSGVTFNGNANFVTLTFKVSSSVREDEQISVTTQSMNATVSTGSSPPTLLLPINTPSYSRSVAGPLSAENNLSSLTISGATLSPAFSENVTNYSAGTVPFTTTKLTVTAIPKDSKAKVSVSGNTLSVGANAIKVTVTAESGATKTYTINITREQDPNYTSDANNKLSRITIDGYVISPPFSKERTSYVVWLPNETTKITVTATPESNKASVRIEGGSNLREGDNEIKIVCTAESGVPQIYLLIAKRASQDGSIVGPTIPRQNTDPNTGAGIIDINSVLEGDISFAVIPENGNNKYSLEDIADAFQLFNIILIKDDEEIQPGGFIQVLIPLPEGYDSSRCKVFRIEADGTRTDMNAEYVVDSSTQQKYMVFTTDHFSLYAIVQLIAKKEAAKASANNMIFYIAMPVLFVGGSGIGGGIGIAAYKGLAHRKSSFKVKSMSKKTGIKHSTAGIKHSTAGMKHSAAGMKHSTTGLKHSTAGMKHSTAGMKHSTAGMKHSTAGIKHNVANIKHSSAGIKHNTASTKHNTKKSRMF